MKKLLLNLALIAATSVTSLHAVTLCQSPAPRTASPRTLAPTSSRIITPADTCIQYVGRISLQHPERPLFNYPGAQINVAFEGTWLRMLCKPQSGFFMVQIDDSEPFKVSFTGRRDSVVTLCTALPEGRHTARLMYCIEGWDLKPEFRGFITDGHLIAPPALPQRRIEFIGNSITCGYGNEANNQNEHYSYETQNHYYSYAQIAARQLGAVASVCARSGIGAYRNYNGPRTGTPDNRMDVQYEYTMYAEKSGFRSEGGAMNERWDFARFRPDVVCMNLGTNDLSTNNYDTRLLKQGYQKLLGMIRQHNPQAKIVLLTGTMLQGKELQICRQLLDEVTDEAHQRGDAEVYRFDMSPQGALGYGADWHPSLAQHQKMADELTAYLRQLMQW